MSDLKQTYIDSDNLYDFVKEQFDSYEDWLEYEVVNAKPLLSWESERLFRIIESAKQGLIEQSVKGNAAAVSHLRSLLGMNQAPGRPVGKNGDSLEKRQAIEQRLQDEYAQDVERLTESAEDN